MAFQPHKSHGGPANAPQNMAVDFNAMLARSVQQQQHEGPPAEVGSAPQSNAGYGGTYPSGSPAPFEQKTLGGGAPPPPQGVLPNELPPQAFLTSTMILDMIDKKVNVVLRDDKTFVGILRSYDQFANLVLTESVERTFAPNPEHGKDPDARRWLYVDVPSGVITVRGENVAVMGSVDLDQEDDIRHCTRSTEEIVRPLANAARAEKKALKAKQDKILRKAGIEPNTGMEG